MKIIWKYLEKMGYKSSKRKVSQEEFTKGVEAFLEGIKTTKIRRRS
jgi:hypothetical protein